MFNTQNLQQYLQDLKQLLAIETPTYNKWGMYKATKFFIKKSKQFNLPVKFYINKYNKKAGRTLTISNVDNPLENKFDVLFMAHLDTVYPKGTFKKTGFNINGDILTAPGCIDDKGPALMGLYALKYMNLDKLKFAFFLNNNEEVGTQDNNKLIQQLSNNANYCINLEAARPNGSLVDQRMGLQRYTVQFSNVVQKTSNNNNANNTTVEMVNFINNVKLAYNAYNNLYVYFKISQADSNKRFDEPKELTLEILTRFASQEGFNKLDSVIKSAVEKNRNKNVQISLNVGQHEQGLYLTPASVSFKKLVEEAGRKIGLKVAWQSSFGGADSTFVTNPNCATLDGFGAIGGDWHTTNEYLQITSLAERIKLLVETTNLIINGSVVNSSATASTVKPKAVATNKDNATQPDATPDATPQNKPQDNAQDTTNTSPTPLAKATTTTEPKK